MRRLPPQQMPQALIPPANIEVIHRLGTETVHVKGGKVSVTLVPPINFVLFEPQRVTGILPYLFQAHIYLH